MINFPHISSKLAEAGQDTPCLVIDGDALDHNLQIVSGLQDKFNVRLVVKSLPSIPLLQYAATALNTNRFMVFHRPNISRIAEAFAGADILIGKPLPLGSVYRCFDDLDALEGFDPEKQIQWLVDTPERLASYLMIAKEKSLRLRINIEINVGLHRGGLSRPMDMDPMLVMIRDNPDHLSFAGFMGYDAHVGAAPPWVGMAAAHRKACARYAAFIARLKKVHPDQVQADTLFNGAGSPTFMLHNDLSPLNEIAFGSALLKPTDFDTATLKAFKPAVYIAAPILKRVKGVNIPFVETVSNFIWGGRDSLFLYGGRWMAKPVYPATMRENPLYGLSSNQQIMTIKDSEKVVSGDFVYLRPTQSEAVMQDFRDVLLVRKQNGQRAIQAHWHSFS